MNENRMLLSSLTHACKLVNDTVKTRLPIGIGLLEVILFELDRMFSTQPYLLSLYQTIISLGYYGLFRVGELTDSPHVIKAANVHLGKNKNKILVILLSSKTHGKESAPQTVKITGGDSYTITKNRFFCPFSFNQEFSWLYGVHTLTLMKTFSFSRTNPR